MKSKATKCKQRTINVWNEVAPFYHNRWAKNEIGPFRVTNDLIFGNAGGDHLVGGEGNDILKGFSGDDKLTGGSGTDVLDGGDDYDVSYDSTSDIIIKCEEQL